MPYPNQHKLLTISGTLFTGVETWSMGLRFSDPGIPTQGQVDACLPFVKSWWQSIGQAAVHKLTHLKLAPIGTDGKYPPLTDAKEADFVPQVQGGSSGAQIHVAQATLVMSLTTGIPRGRGHIGRVFVPMPAVGLVSSGTVDTVSVDSYLASFRTMVLGLNGIAGMGGLSIITKLGSAAQVTGFRCGLVPDTMRSRRRSMPELPRALAL